MRVLVMKGHILNFIYLLFQGFFLGGGGGRGVVWTRIRVIVSWLNPA